MATLTRTVNSPLTDGSTETLEPFNMNVTVSTPPAGWGSVTPGWYQPLMAASQAALSVLNNPGAYTTHPSVQSIGWGLDTPGKFIPKFSSDKATAANELFALAIGGAGVGSNGPFSSTRVDMGGVWEVIPKTDPRHTSHAYQDRYPDLFAGYQAGTLTGTQLFNQALDRSVRFDSDDMNTANFNFSAPPRVKFNFNSSGGGTISGTGISFGGLTGTWTGSSRSPFNFGF